VGVDELNLPADRVEPCARVRRVVNLGLAVHDVKHAARGLGGLAGVGRALRRLPHARAEHKHAEDGDKHALKLVVGKGGDGRVVVGDVDPPVPVHEGKREEERPLRVALDAPQEGALAHLLLDEAVHGVDEALVHLVLHRERGDGAHRRHDLADDAPRLLRQAGRRLPLGAPRDHGELDGHPRDHDGHAGERDEHHGPVPEEEGEEEGDDEGEEGHGVAPHRLPRERLHHVDLGRERRAQRPRRVLGHVVPPDLLPHEGIVEEHPHLDSELLAGHAKAPPAHRVADHLAEGHGGEQGAPEGGVAADDLGVREEDCHERLDKDEAHDGVGAPHEERPDAADEEVELVPLVHRPDALGVALVLVGLRGLFLLFLLLLRLLLLLGQDLDLLRSVGHSLRRRRRRRRRGRRAQHLVRLGDFGAHPERLGAQGAHGAPLLAPPRARATLRLLEAKVVAVSDRHQLVVRPLLDDPPLLHHADLVRVPDRRQPVRDDNRRPLRLLHQLVERRLHHLLARRVQRTRRLVQQQHRRVLDHRARNRHALLLPPREETPLLADVGVKLVGKLLDKVVSVRHPGRLLHLLPGRPRLSARNVVGDRPREEHGLLPHQADLGPQPAHVERRDVVPVE